VTARVAELTLQGEARHVAFALDHLGEHVAGDPRYRDRLRAATERRRCHHGRTGAGRASDSEAADLSALHTRNFM
jgi:hypothetical protein